MRRPLFVVAVVGLLGTGCAASPGTTSPASPSLTATQSAAAGRALLTDRLVIEPGSYAVPPGPYGWANCEVPPPTGCPPEPAHADSMVVEVTIPDGWQAGGDGTVIKPSPGGAEGPDGAALVLRWSGLTTGLHSDPCLPVSHAPTDIAVGVTVDDFMDAVVAHPTLQVTAPVDAELGGYPGRFFTLTGPSDISACDNWRPWEPGIYVQGPDNIWRVWAIDVDGLRVILLTEEFAATPAEVKSELAQIVDSIRFVPNP